MPHEPVSCAPRRSTPSAISPLGWTGFGANTFLFSLAATSLVLYAVYYHGIARTPASRFGCKNIAWLLP